MKNINFTARKVLFVLSARKCTQYNVLVYSKISSGKKNYFFGYLYNEPYVKSYDGQTERKYFFIDDYDLLNKYNTIWDKFSTDIEKKIDSKPVYNKMF